MRTRDLGKVNTLREKALAAAICLMYPIHKLVQAKPAENPHGSKPNRE